MAIYGYARVSTSKQEDSQQTQERHIEEYVKSKRDTGEFAADNTYGGCFVDSATSGSTKMFERPAGYELFTRLKSGDSIVLTKLDRGFRNTADACQTMDMLKQRGVKIHCLQLGVSPDDPIGRFIYSVIAAFAELERNFIVARITDGIDNARRNGRAVNRFAPIGYKKHGKGKNSRFVPDREEQKVCYWIVEQKNDHGKSFKKIHKELSGAGVIRNSTGHVWTLKSVMAGYKAVQNNFPAYSGKDMSEYDIATRLQRGSP